MERSDSSASVPRVPHTRRPSGPPRLPSASGTSGQGSGSLRHAAPSARSGCLTAWSGSPLDLRGGVPFGGDEEVSQVPGQPLPTCPALRPRRADAPDHPAHRCRLPALSNRRLPAILLFGAPSRGPRAPFVRFAPPVARRNATLGSGWGSAVPVRGSHPLGCTEGSMSTSSSSSPSLAWRSTVDIRALPRGLYPKPSPPRSAEAREDGAGAGFAAWAGIGVLSR